MNQNLPGHIYYIEGIDGAGKSTLIKELQALFRNNTNVIFSKEPGGTIFGNKVKEILYNHENIAPEAQFLLFAADRAQHIHEKVFQALNQGKTIICDRGPDSSLVYQSFRSGLPLTTLQTINTWVMRGIQPTQTFYLRITPEQAAQRIVQRNGKTTDLFEQQVLQDLEVLYNGFESLYTNNKHVSTLDALQPSKELAKIVYNYILTQSF